jgi:coenzyme F420-0:L-glutamate ligase/coenzyme F420-1:gamma-L-glutamate ligase
VDALEAITGRRSVRRFAARAVPRELLAQLIAAALAAPAPHHSRPWRFVEVSAESRPRLIEAMADAWRADLPPDAADAPLDRSRRQLSEAPLLLLACLDLTDARASSDERRRAAERDMFVQSLGAALQNLLLAAHALGLGGFLKGAPLFCAGAVRGALELPNGWQPAFLILLGYPDPDVNPSPRDEPDLGAFLTHR